LLILSKSPVLLVHQERRVRLANQEDQEIQDLRVRSEILVKLGREVKMEWPDCRVRREGLTLKTN
jgi:hypothetical protein